MSGPTSASPGLAPHSAPAATNSPLQLLLIAQSSPAPTSRRRQPYACQILDSLRFVVALHPLESRTCPHSASMVIPLTFHVGTALGFCVSRSPFPSQIITQLAQPGHRLFGVAICFSLPRYSTTHLYTTTHHSQPASALCPSLPTPRDRYPVLRLIILSFILCWRRLAGLRTRYVPPLSARSAIPFVAVVVSRNLFNCFFPRGSHRGRGLSTTDSRIAFLLPPLPAASFHTILCATSHQQ
jgi:hypothetical protein